MTRPKSYIPTRQNHRGVPWTQRQKEGLFCSHCDCHFIGSYKQTWRHHQEQTPVYCSPTCRKAAISKKFTKPRINRACEYCGIGFEQPNFPSVPARKYCSMRCYTSSDQFLEQLAHNRDNILHKPAYHKYCIECGKELKASNKKRAKYCSQLCYRSYMARRFDRWFNNPRTIHGLQGYDEFLLQEKLPCLIDGCDWVGTDLTQHVNLAHGIPAREFKRAAGFNYGTGVVGVDRLKALKEMPHNAVNLEKAKEVLPDPAFPSPSNPDQYYSREGKEHRRKSRQSS